MLNRYKPEGFLIATSENREYLATETGRERAFEKQKVLEAVALLCDSDYNLHFDLCGMPAIMPRKEVQFLRTGDSVKDIAVLTRVGKPVAFRIIGFRKNARGEDMAILSRRSVQKDCEEEYVDTLVPGDVIPATVTHMESFGAFLDIGCGVVSLLSIDAMSVSRITHPRDRLRVGDRISVVVKSIDENRRIYVSQRELFGTWEENAARFRAGETVAGVVRSIEPYGIFVELAPNLAGLAELKEDVEVGDTAAVYIKSILPDKMKLKLVIIDTQRESEKRKRPEYFIDVEETKHIAYWRYSPEHCKKIVETHFDS